MRPGRIALLAALGALAALGTVGATPALAAPSWKLEIHHSQTHFPPGGKAQYWFDIDNVGSDPSSEPIVLTVNLPPGLTREKVITEKFEFIAGPQLKWSCPGAAGDSTVVCTTQEGSIPRHTLAHLILEVKVAADAAGELTAGATLEGGGALEAVSDSEPTPVSPTPADFGIVASSFVPDFFEADGLTTERAAGGHSNNLVVPLDFNSIAAPIAGRPTLNRAAENIRNLTVDLPPGFVGIPTAIGECTQAEFLVGDCPLSSQVGRIDGSLYPPGAGLVWNFTAGVFNMVHPRGAASDLGFQVVGNPVHVKVSLDPENDYAIRTSVADINETQPVFSSKVTTWGVPADPTHDSERCPGLVGGNTSEECSTDIARKPFLTNPSQCEADNVFRVHHYNSWENTEVYGPDVSYTMPGKMTGCDKPRFEPEVSLEPTGKQANTPTGLSVRIAVPQNQNPNGRATPPLKSAVVTLPPGMTLSPSFADGLQGCSLAQIGISAAGVPGGNPVACPDNSRIGEVSLTTPLVPEPIEGSMYLARQEENPFGSLLAVYLAVHDTEERGVLIKVPGKISLDPGTGQITTTFDELPQFPFDELTLKFRSGERAPLVNPPTCGAHTIAATMTSRARPGEQVDVSNTYRVIEGPGGGACQDVASRRPFDPQLIAGTLSPLAGAFSPLSVRVFRSDADQELSSAEGTAPPGLTASLRGVTRCSDAQIAAARARSLPGQGALELASPSCPASSQVGTLQAGVGAGPAPIYVPGKIYLSGPYKGAPLSGVAIVPAIAGPADLGNVVVRAPAYVNPRTARIRIATDPLPQIVNGVLVRARDIRIHLDRPGFSLNPTSCEPKAIEASLLSTEGALKADSEHFQVASCASLGFKPRLGLRLTGGSKRGGHPALSGAFRPRAGDANLEELVLRLPHSAFLDQAHIRTICTRVQFAAKQCPAGAIYGNARAFTPLLDEPLEGPVYLRSSTHKLPDLVVDLHGIVDFEAVARIDSANGGIRASFEEVPDAPLTKVVVSMLGGKKGLIVNSTNLCVAKQRADVQMNAQNGKLNRIEPLVRADCGKKRNGTRRHR